MKKFLLYIFMGLLTLVFNEAKAESTIQLNWISPASGEVYSTATEEGNVSFVFNGIVEDLQADAIYIVLPGGEKIEVQNYDYTCAFYSIFSCHIGNQMTRLVGEGKIKPGDSFKVRIEGLKRSESGEVYGSDGVCEATYVLADMPAELLSTSLAAGSEIPAFTKPDPNSEEGKVVFVFTDPVIVGSAVYATGGREDLSYKEITLPFTIEGEKVIVNLQGIALDPESLGLDPSYNSGTIKLRDVKRVSDGMFVKGDQGSEGSVSLFVNIKETVSETIYGGIIHDNADIDKDEVLVLYATEEFGFDAIKFSYKVGGVQADVAFDGKKFVGMAVDGGYEYHIPLTDFIFDAGDVDVSVEGARSAFNQEFVFQAWTFTSAGRKTASGTKVFNAEPVENEIVSSMPYIKILFNEPVTIESAVLVNNDDDKVYQLNEMPSATIEMKGLEAFIATGVTDYGRMTLTVRAKNAAGSYVTYGAVEDCMTMNFQVKQDALYLVSSTPEDGAVVDAIKDIYLKFESTLENDIVGGFAKNAVARLLTIHGKEVAAGTLSADPNDYLGVVVTLDKIVEEAGDYVLLIDEKSIFNNGFNSEDENYGVGLEGWNALYNVTTSVRFKIEATNSATYIPSVITPNEGEVTTLEKLVLKFDTNVGGFDETKSVILTKEGSDAVVNATLGFGDGWDDVFVTFPAAITEAGNYTLTIPEGTIYNELFDPMMPDFGASLGVTYNPELVYKFQVAGTDGIECIVGDAAAEVKVYSLAGVLVAEGKAGTIEKTLASGVYVVNGKKVLVK